MNYTVIRSARKTTAIEIKGQSVIVRAPYSANDGYISDFVQKHSAWIEKHLLKNADAIKSPRLTAEELHALAQQASEVVPKRVEYYAEKIGVTYGRITIRAQKTRWGSCSSKGNLNFNCLLMLAPQQVLDCVVVHELCHRKEMNHSKRFYRQVLAAFPEYHKYNDWLKENGASLLASISY